MTTYKSLREIGAEIQGNIINSEKVNEGYKITINDHITDDKISFFVQSRDAEDILHNKDRPFRFIGNIKYDYDEKNNKRSNIVFTMEEYQILDNSDFIEAIGNIRGRNIKLPDNFANDLIKDRYKD